MIASPRLHHSNCLYIPFPLWHCAGGQTESVRTTTQPLNSSPYCGSDINIQTVCQHNITHYEFPYKAVICSQLRMPATASDIPKVDLVQTSYINTPIEGLHSNSSAQAKCSHKTDQLSQLELKLLTRQFRSALPDLTKTEASLLPTSFSPSRLHEIKLALHNLIYGVQ